MVHFVVIFLDNFSIVFVNALQNDDCIELYYLPKNWTMVSTVKFIALISIYCKISFKMYEG